MYKVCGNIAEGFQNKCTQVRARVGEDEVGGIVDDLIVVKNQVDVDRSGGIQLALLLEHIVRNFDARGTEPLAAKFFFNGLRLLQDL